jgi:hypothetical protein
MVMTMMAVIVRAETIAALALVRGTLGALRAGSLLPGARSQEHVGKLCREVAILRQHPRGYIDVHERKEQPEVIRVTSIQTMHATVNLGPGRTASTYRATNV